ncbi:uncharacterized protein [Populus alba]|uniref:uncharacterized protein isoform X1 n=1 Tax=Populus alba TaxID=43335 RepID=UPI003CC75546
MERVKAQEEHEEQSNQNWSETVEDLVTAGDTEGAITLLETEVSRLETLNPSEAANLQLVSALTELAKLYSSKHFSLKSDELLSRASLIKQRTSGDVESVEKEDEISKCNAVSNDGHLEKSSNPRDDVSPCSDDATERPRRRVFQFLMEKMENVFTRATSLELLVLMTETCSFASRTLMRGYLMLRKMIYRKSSPPL